MERVLALEAAVLLQLEPVAVVHAVLHRVVVAPLAIGASERDLRAVAFLLGHAPPTVSTARSSWPLRRTSGGSPFFYL